MADDDQKAMLMSMSDSGATWMRSYEIDTNDIVLFSLTVDLEPTADGNVVFVGSENGNGFVMKVDQFGNLVWSTEMIFFNGGLWLTGAHELPSGDLLVAGYTYIFPDITGLAMRLTSLGGIIWQRRFEASGQGLVGDFFSNDAGELKLITDQVIFDLDSTGSGCGFVDISEISANPINLVVTAVPFTNSAMDLSFLPEDLPERYPVTHWTHSCDPNGIKDPYGSHALVAHPVPSPAYVLLGKPGEVAANERVIIRDITGAIMADLQYGTALDLREYAPGLYFCVLPRLGQHARIVKQ